MIFPKISVVTPCLNQAAYLEETILSVVNQNYPNLEYIIIDGGSTDGSINIIKKYSSKLAYWESQKDSGQSEAINKGLKRCTGDVVTWLCSDDCYLDGALNKVGIYFNSADYSFLYGRSILYGKGRQDKLIGFSNRKDIPTKCLAYTPFPQPSTFFRKKILFEQGYLDESLHFGMDHDLFIRIILNYNAYGVDDVFSKYRYHEAGKSNFPLKFAGDRNRVFSKVLRSFSDSEPLIDVLKEAGYYNDEKDFYKFSSDRNCINLQAAFVSFLQVQMHYYYQALDKKNAASIARLLLNYDNELIDKVEAKKIYRRSRLLDRRIISLLRQFTKN